jgi:hypothetical protein
VKRSIAVQKTQEYHLADHLTQHWAFNHPDNYATFADVIERSDAATTQRCVRVMTNTHQVLRVPVKIESYDIRPAGGWETKNRRVGGQYETYYMVTGSDPQHPAAEFFTASDFLNCQDYTELKLDIEKLYDEFHKRHAEEVRRTLLKSLCVTALDAAAELPSELQAGCARTYNWFLINKINVAGLQPADFQYLVSHYSATGLIVSSWVVTVDDKSIQYKIDWAQKKILKHEMVPSEYAVL